MKVKVARCVICNQEFTQEEIAGFECCPKCGAKGLPANPKDDVNVKINWHELRILCIWAEQWAARRAKEKSEIKPEVTIACIAERLQKQFPGKTPLTLAGEVGQLRKHYKLETNINDKPRKIAKEFNA